MTPTRHKIPTGLTVEDRFITYGSFSLSLREFLLLLAGAAVGYGGVWKGWPGAPAPLRAVAAALPVVAALALALARPGGRPPEQWAFIVARYWRLPRTTVWRPRAPRPADWHPLGLTWASLAPSPAWGTATPPPAARRTVDLTPVRGDRDGDRRTGEEDG